jgi:hypothetical protein
VSLLGRDESDASDHGKIVKTRCIVELGPQHSRYRDGLEDRIYDIIQIHAAISLFVVFKQSSRTAACDVYVETSTGMSLQRCYVDLMPTCLAVDVLLS